MSLNEEIGREEQFKTGSQRLFSASLDPRTKEQAALEMSFAESKIQVFQAELAKLNSSLQAYQKER